MFKNILTNHSSSYCGLFINACLFYALVILNVSIELEWSSKIFQKIAVFSIYIMHKFNFKCRI